jgi:hypothetical protein
MMLRFEKSRRGLSIGLAIWLGWLWGAVQALHSHPVPPCYRGGTELVRNSELGVPLEPTELVRVPPNDAPATRLGDLCPICMFLAHYRADHPITLLSPATGDRESGLAICTRPTFVASPAPPTFSPRAPPLRPL